jgi:argininosuccinate lyase
VDGYLLSLAALTGMIADLTAKPEVMAAAAGIGHATATDLADWLVRALHLPFRDAHHVVGAAVKRADALGAELADLPLAEFHAIEPRITAEAVAGLTAEASVATRKSYGGTAPSQVRAQINRWKERLA